MTLRPSPLPLYGLFAVPGFALATWATRTPALRDALGASLEQMGAVLFGFSVGSMCGILSAAPLNRRFGPRRAMAAGAVALLVGLGVIAGGAVASLPSLAFAGFLAFGLGMGWLEIAANVEGAELERRLHRPLLPNMHGCFSAGALLGAVSGLAFTALAVPVAWHLWAVAALGVAVAWPLLQRVQDLSRATAQAGGVAVGSVRAVLADRRVLLIGLVVLAMALAEGSANDWLPLLMVDGHGFSQTAGTLAYVLFMAGMVVGRFGGHRLLHRFSAATLVRASAVASAASIAVVVFCDGQLWAALAVFGWGLSAALGFPLSISAAGEGGGDAARRVTVVATLGYVAFLVGPPMLGLLGEHHGLRLAMLPVLGMVLLAAVLAPALSPRRAAVPTEAAAQER